MSVSADKVTLGLNKTGLFFEEVVRDELLKEKRFTALKEQRTYSYRSSATSEFVSGTADYVGFYHSERIGRGVSTIFGIECKKVSTAKTWVFVPMQEDDFSTLVDRPNYVCQLELNDQGAVSRRSAKKVYLSEMLPSIKAYEMRDSGNVFQNNDEKIYNACRQSVEATNGFYLDDYHIGLAIFDRQGLNFNLNYVPLVITNAEIMTAAIDKSMIDVSTGEVAKNGLTLQSTGWTYHAVNLMPEQRCSMSMLHDDGVNRVSLEPTRRLVPIVNINHIDDFLTSYRSLVI